MSPDSHSAAYPTAGPSTHRAPESLGSLDAQPSSSRLEDASPRTSVTDVPADEAQLGTNGVRASEEASEQPDVIRWRSPSPHSALRPKRVGAHEGRQGPALDTEHDDADEMWEDELSSEDEEAAEGSWRDGSSSGDSPTGTPRDGRQRNGYRDALHQYRSSRRALMRSESSSLDGSQDIDGEYAGSSADTYVPGDILSSDDAASPVHASSDDGADWTNRRDWSYSEASSVNETPPHRARVLKRRSRERTASPALQLPLDPYARSAEAADEAAPVGRAHDVLFSPLDSHDEQERLKPARPALQQGKHSSERILSPHLQSTARLQPIAPTDHASRSRSPRGSPRRRSGATSSGDDTEGYASDSPRTPTAERRSPQRLADVDVLHLRVEETPSPTGSVRRRGSAQGGRRQSLSQQLDFATRRESLSSPAQISPSPNARGRDPNGPASSSSRRSSSDHSRRSPEDHHNDGGAAQEQMAQLTSLWDYLREEVLATDFDSTQEMKWERVTNFIAIPFWMEKIISFGFVVCLDSFLYTFTILPLRFAVALFTLVRHNVVWALGGQRRHLHSSHKCDLLKTALIVLSCTILSRITDASKMYHSVRGQDVVKLSVIFNVLEIADRLCCSFGQDLLDSLFSRITLARRKDGRQPYLRPAGFFLLSLAYVLAHTFVLFYQLVTLNVAINSYDNALLTLLLSNQFVEIKGSVFKKFEKENLFQLTCADIVERFQLTLMLSAIGMRNLIEVAGITASIDGGTGPLPTSFTVFPSFNTLETVIAPVAIVLASECMVDWLKHAFITKFNHIRPAVYGRFMDVLCRDLVVAGPATARSSSSGARKHTFVDQSPLVARRLGFAALPLACLLVRITMQILGMLRDTSHYDECAAPYRPPARFTMGHGVAQFFAAVLGARDPESAVNHAAEVVVRSAAWILTGLVTWVFLVGLKLILGTNLVSFASHRYATMQQREREEELNARDRAPIGVDHDEKAYDAKIAELVNHKDDDATRIGLHGQQDAGGAGKDGKKKPGPIGSLMDVSRYSMIKSRIW